MKKVVITEQVIKFVDEYVKSCDRYEAARLAGVKERHLDATVETWSNHPTVIAMIEQRRAKERAKGQISTDWVAAELKAMYGLAKEDGDNASALKALDMMARHVGLYAADKSQEKPVVVNVVNYAGAKIGD